MVQKRARKRTKVQLTEKEERFAQEFVKSHNKTQAAILAGYKAETANTYGRRLYAKDHIAARIAELEAAICAQVELETADILLTLKRIAEFSVKKIATYDGKEFRVKPMDEWPEGADVAIAGFKQTIREGENKSGHYRDVTVDLKFENKQTACVSLGEHLGMFTGYDQIVKAAESYGKKLVDADA